MLCLCCQTMGFLLVYQPALHISRGHSYTLHNMRINCFTGSNFLQKLYFPLSIPKWWIMCTLSLCAFHIPSPFFSFVSLLEHAEEELRCRTVYVFFEQCVSAELRRQILHSFHLMGFQIVPPSDPTVSLVGSQYYFMSYELEDSDDDED